MGREGRDYWEAQLSQKQGLCETGCFCNYFDPFPSVAQAFIPQLSKPQIPAVTSSSSLSEIFPETSGGRTKYTYIY